MGAAYSIEADPERDLIRIRMSGFFTQDDILGFVAAREMAHAKLRCGRNRHLTINDVRDMKIQSGDVVDAFQQLLADPAYRSRRLAFVAGPTLARMQLSRALADRDHVRCFDDTQDAEAWLLSDEAARSCAA